MLKRLSFIFLAVMIMIGILAGCSSSKQTSATSNKGSGKTSSNQPSKNFNKTGFPIVNKKITLTIFGPLAGKTPWKKRKFFEIMKKKTNIQFKFETPPLQDFKKKKNLFFGSGNYPDVLYGANISNQEQVKYGSKEGILIPLDGLIKKYAPHIEKMLQEHPNVKKDITAPDGHIYALPYVSLDSNRWARGELYYNGQWLKNLGVTKLPRTTGQLFHLLMRFKNDDPNKNGKKDEIPITAAAVSSSVSPMADLRNWFLGAFGEMDYAYGGIELKNGKVKYSPIQPGYKQYLKYMHKLWTHNLLDHESFSQTADQKAAKQKNGKIGLSSFWLPSGYPCGANCLTDNPMMYPVKAPGVKKPIIPVTDGVRNGTFAITKADKYPVATIRWIDYSYSKKGYDLLNNGPKGYFWKWENTNKKKVRIKKNPPKSLPSGVDFQETITPNYGIAVPGWSKKTDWHWAKNKNSLWGKEQTDKKIKPYGKTLFPPVYLTKDELNKVNRITRNLTSYVQQMEAKFITGKKPISDWNQYVNTIKGMGIDKMIKIYTQAYKRYQNK